MKLFKKISTTFLLAILVLTMVIPLSANGDEVKYPTEINGMPVILIETQENNVSMAKDQVKLVLLDIISKTDKESSARLNIDSYLKENPLPSNVSFEVYGGPGITEESILTNQANNNEYHKKYGVYKINIAQTSTECIKTLFNTAGPFQVDQFDDPQSETLNFQTVMIPAPTITGTYEDAYVYFGNNVMTSSNYFLQSGQIYDNYDHTRLVWADSSTNCNVQDFNIDYVGGHIYTHEIYYHSAGTGNYKKWTMAVYDNTSSVFAYHIETQAYGTSIKHDINTSVFFENYNTSDTWYSGFASATVTATQAWKGYGSVVGGSWTGWMSSFNSDTFIDSGYGSMSGSLASWGTTYWTLSAIPLGTP